LGVPLTSAKKGVRHSQALQGCAIAPVHISTEKGRNMHRLLSSSPFWSFTQKYSSIQS